MAKIRHYFTRQIIVIISILTISLPHAASLPTGTIITPDGIGLFFEHVEVQPQIEEKGTVIFLHGWGMSSNEWAGFKERFQEDGWATMAFDFRGHGASLEAHDRQLDYHEMESPPQRKKLLIDIQMAMDYLLTDKPVWLVGSSVGANYALKYAAKNKRVHGVVLIGPGYDNFGILQKSTIKSYGARPLMLIAARNNPWSMRTSMDLKQRTEGPAVLYGVQSGHEMDGLRNKEPFAPLIIQWMNEQTPGAAQVTSHFSPESVVVPVHIKVEQIG